ncbi:MAG: 6-phosphogluconolactonase [Candidatus Eisenbacteria bacterium]|nr:6-phosphogluconolactonase [Candidatus Eisenbacteria bacterium]
MAVHILDSTEALASAAAERVASAATRATAAGGNFDLALSGGRTPRGLYRELVLGRYAASIAWPRVHLWFADERAVPPDDPRSNWRLVRETLAQRAGLTPAQVHRMRGEDADLERAAADYEAILPASLDLVVLGVGEDGHVASIFPGAPPGGEGRPRVMAVFDAPKPPARRLTLTARALREARAVIVLASGSEKAEAVRRALEEPGDAAEVPARLVRERDWFLDREAAAALGRG